MQELENIAAPSEEVQEILDHSPNWLIRNGISIIFIILLLTIGASLVIRYPIFIRAKALITSSNPPVTIVAQGAGKITLLKQEGQFAQAGEYLVVIENTAVTDDVLSVKVLLDSFSISGHFPKKLIEQSYQVGSIQPNLSKLIISLQRYFQLFETDYFSDKLQSQSEQGQLYNQMTGRLKTQNQLIQQEVDISAKRFLKQQELYLSGLITKEEFEQAELEYLQKKQQLKSNEIGRLTNDVSKEKIQASNLEERHLFEETKQQLGIEIAENHKQLLSSIKSWEQQFILKSPCDGVLSYSKPYGSSQFINKGEEVLTVEPNSSDIKAMVSITQQNSGKVKPGLKVNIKLYNYPEIEYGLISGEVKNVSSVSFNNNYLVEVRLSKGLKTTYGKVIPYQNNLEGEAEIITDNLLLFSRIFNQVDAKSK